MAGQAARMSREEVASKIKSVECHSSRSGSGSKKPEKKKGK